MPTYAELLVLCHEAAERRANKTGAFRGIHHDHAEAERMSLAFIQDRIDTVRAYVTHLSTILPHMHRQQSSPASSFLLAPTTKCVFMLLYICVLILRCICADPMRGYTVRTDDTHRRLQGFIWFTTFTSWTHFFKWDSKSPDAGLRGTGGLVQYTTRSCSLPLVLLSLRP